MSDFDLPYILSHPLLGKIHAHLGKLKDQADALPIGSRQRAGIEKRISELEEYHLPKPDASDLGRSRVVQSPGGHTVKLDSMRRRFKDARRGRPADYRIRVRAALEEKLANPNLTWEHLAEKYGFNDPAYGSQSGRAILERGARELKEVLRREGI